MPFRSVDQRKFLWSQYPEIAERWTKEHGSKVVPFKKSEKKGMTPFLRDILNTRLLKSAANDPGSRGTVTPSSTTTPNIDYGLAKLWTGNQGAQDIHNLADSASGAIRNVGYGALAGGLTLPLILSPTLLGGALGAARSPRGYAMQNAGRGALYGLGGTMGALTGAVGGGLLAGAPVTGALGGGAGGLLLARLLMGQHPKDKELKAKAQKQANISDYFAGPAGLVGNTLGHGAIGAGIGAGTGGLIASILEHGQGPSSTVPSLALQGALAGGALGSTHGLATSIKDFQGGVHERQKRQDKLKDDRVKRDEALIDDQIKRQRSVQETFVTKYILPRLAEEKGLVKAPVKIGRVTKQAGPVSQVPLFPGTGPVEGPALHDIPRIDTENILSPYLNQPGLGRGAYDQVASPAPLLRGPGQTPSQAAVRNLVTKNNMAAPFMWNGQPPEYRLQLGHSDQTTEAKPGLTVPGELPHLRHVSPLPTVPKIGSSRRNKVKLAASQTLGRLLKTADTPYEGVHQTAIYENMPVGKRRNKLTPEEEEQIAQGKSQWFPQVFPDYTTSPAKLMASPLKNSLLVGSLGPLAGAAIGAATSKTPDHWEVSNENMDPMTRFYTHGLRPVTGGYTLGNTLSRASVGALIGAIPGLGLGAINYFGRKAKNNDLEESMRRNAPNANLRDLTSDSVFDRDRHQPGMGSRAQDTLLTLALLNSLQR